MKYYKSLAKLGHQGTGKFAEITFYIKANNVSEAYIKVLNMPGVKHNNNSAILKMTEISKEEYKEHLAQSAYEKFKKS